MAYVKGTQDDLRAHSAPHPALKTIDAYLMPSCSPPSMN
jgi:hypothetical protein